MAENDTASQIFQLLKREFELLTGNDLEAVPEVSHLHIWNYCTVSAVDQIYVLVTKLFTEGIRLPQVTLEAFIYSGHQHGLNTRQEKKKRDVNGKTAAIIVTIILKYYIDLTCPCFQHSLKIFQLLLLLGSCRQRSLPSHSQECDVCGSKTLRPMTPSLRPPNIPSSLPSEAPVRRPSAFLVSTTEAMMWSRKFGRLLFILSL